MNLTAWISAIADALRPALDIVNLPRILPGRTSADQIRKRMGKPGCIHRNADGSETWEYSRQPAGIHCYMIDFDRQHVVRRVEQVLNQAHYAKVGVGMTRDDVRRCLGAPASTAVFKRQGEEVWEWHVQGMLPNEESYFMVHFDIANGQVTKTSQRVAMRA